MKFHINELIMWMKNGNVRKLFFKPNKVNIVTGESNTGKTVIWAIIDYCLFSSEPQIPEDIINENVDWYGINFNINDEVYTIAREGINLFGTPSTEYYFSGSGEIPEKPEKNINEDEIKKYMEAQFEINDKVVIPYGGKEIRQGSKISLRYFLLFNTQGENTIVNSDTFFDKQTQLKYKEALERIFDLSIGIDTVRETLIKEKLISLENERKKMSKKSIALEKENKLFEKNMRDLLLKAKEYQLISDLSKSFEEELNEIKHVILQENESIPSTEINDFDKLDKQRWELIKKIKKLKRFENEYNSYKSLIDNNIDSLQPIEYIHNNYSEIIETPLVKEFVSQLKVELNEIKRSIKKKSPVKIDVKSQLNSLQTELYKINTAINLLPQNYKQFDNHKQKYVLIGEIKTRMQIYEKDWEEENYDTQIQLLSKEIDELKKQLGNREDKKEAVIRLLQEIIQVYLDKSENALANYAGFKAVFDHRDKKLRLQKPFSTVVENVIGSSSNHLFLHLCLFLGLHELIMRQEVPFVAPFLFLDQPSRPYYDNKAEKAKSDSDRAKITIAMQLLNDFVTRVNDELKREFQFIVLEHIPSEIWTENSMNNFYLVEEFRDGNKLIRNEDINHNHPPSQE
ncbi:DUF3732 domain-containing protein [Paenibacillus taichungensis]|uniref:DUF3732 domain-containing protein n=4 Tax=Paenibacillus TaxID=44249 RepID=A0A329QTE5_9BACL|nr:DUF3732 domain-containing protein [Paenibacillus sp. JX-17]RAW15523.1 DUF3732 domain-containing protein [Paenibacillus taichungensis]